MARVKQFADDLGISKNQAQSLINKGRSRKDGGSQILENVMKPKAYKDGGSETNPKAPVAKVKKEGLPTLHSEKQKAELQEYKDFMIRANRKAQLKNRKPERKPKRGKIEKPKADPMSRLFGKDGETKLRPRSQAPYHSEFNPDQYHQKLNPKGTKGKPEISSKNKKAGGGLPDLTGDGKVTRADVLKGRGVPGFSRGGGMAIQGLGFKGVR